MAYKFNPFTGELDLVAVPVRSGAGAPVLNSNGDLQVAYVSNSGRVYFKVGGNDYYIVGTVPDLAVINSGQPIGFGNLGITYP